MSESLLEISELSAGYGPIRVLKAVDIRARAGSLTAVLGPNCAGKSTLFKAILGLVKTSEGKIVYKGRNIEHADTISRVRDGISLVPEGRGLFPSMTVRDNLLLGAFLLRRKRLAAATELERVMSLFPVLETRMKMSVSSLSGGQQQMVAIGRALMSRPDVILLDEPSLGLAPIVFQEVISGLDALRSEGRTIVLAEQNVRTAIKYADHVYLMRNGTVVVDGDAASFADLGEHGIGYFAGSHEH